MTMHRDTARLRLAALATDRDELNDRDHVRFLDDPEWYNVGELRAAAGMPPERSTPLTNDQLRDIARELGRRDPQFAAVLRTRDGTGFYGTFADGERKFTFEVSADGTVVIKTPAYAPPTNAVTAAAAEASDGSSYAPPDPYKAGLDALRAADATLRAATATPESTFAERYAAERMRDLQATRDALDAAPEITFPHLTTAEEAELTATYAPPEGYTIALNAMKERQK